MGQKYESKKKSVSENKESMETNTNDQSTLREEYSILSSLDGMISDLEDEVFDAVGRVENVGELEENRLKEEKEDILDERKEIVGEIEGELDKLQSGLRKLEQLDKFEFGSRANDSTKNEYKKMIEKYRDLIGDLGDPSSNESGGYENGASSTEGIFEKQDDILGMTSEDSTLISNLQPTRSTPRDLPTTQYGFSLNSRGDMEYDSPNEMAKYLYASQGSAYANFQGTCGLCSCANILRLVGVNATEKDIIDYAANTHIGDGIFSRAFTGFQRLCTTNSSPDSNGGTNAYTRQTILEHFGISSGIFSVKMDGDIVSDETINDIANFVSDGRGVIISVDANVLYNPNYPRGYSPAYHAVTVTSVTKNKYGDVSGFYIADSNVGTTFYPINHFREFLTDHDMNVTHSHIR